MQLSVSRSDSFEPKFHRLFDATPVPNISDILRIVATKIWSPIIWHGGVRKRSNFAACKYAALDFDDGRWTLKDAAAFCEAEGLSFVLGTSKSHQKEKRTLSGKVAAPCDRFRLVIPFTRLIVDQYEYEATMRHLRDILPTDPACVDAARFFYPCKEIIAYAIRPERLPVQPGDVVREELAEVEERQAANTERMRETGIVPAWVPMVLRFGVGPDQSRHQMCYRLGATLVPAGWTPEELVSAIMRSPLSEIGRADVTRAVLNGAEKAKEQQRGSAHG